MTMRVRRSARKVLLAAAGLWAIPTGTATAQSAADSLAQCVSVRVTYDRFTGTTSAETEDDPIHEIDVTIGLQATAVGPRLGPTASALLSFSSASSDWRFLKAHSLALLLDDSTRVSPDTEHDGDVGGGRVTETVTARLTLAQMRRIGAARNVEGRLGGWEFRIPLAYARAIGQVARFIEQGSRGGVERWMCPWPP